MVGIYIGLSFSGFWKYDDTVWYNLTDAIYSKVGEGNSLAVPSSSALHLCQHLINISPLFTF